MTENIFCTKNKLDTIVTNNIIQLHEVNKEWLFQKNKLYMYIHVFWDVYAFVYVCDMFKKYLKHLIYLSTYLIYMTSLYKTVFNKTYTSFKHSDCYRMMLL